MALTKSFEELHCWQVATEIRRDLSKLAKTFPADEKFTLKSQVVRASRSVTNNIAEGFGRYHYQEQIKFCRIARGSLYELIDHLIIALDEGYISTKKISEIREKIEKCKALLNGFIKYLKAQKEDSKNVEEPLIEYSNPRINQSTN